MTILVFVVLAIALIWVLAYHAVSATVWSVAVAIALIIASATDMLSGVVAGMVWLTFLAVAIVANVKSLRQSLLTVPIFGLYKKVLPQMSQTEQEALEAGTVWWDGDLFSGKPDWNKWLNVPKAKLTEEEQAFIDGPTNELCSMIDEWKTTHELHDLEPKVWQFIKDNGFLGMIIPKEYGGKGFSAYGHSQTVMKISTRSATAAVSVMVPNSTFTRK